MPSAMSMLRLSVLFCGVPSLPPRGIRKKTAKPIIKKTEIVGPKVPESFNVLVKELQGLGLKVDLVHSNTIVDAEEVLASNIHEEATHLSDIDVPQAAISDIDVTEEAVSDEYAIVDIDDDMVTNNDDSAATDDVALVAATDDKDESEEA